MMTNRQQKDAAIKVATYIAVIERVMQDTPGLTSVRLAGEMQ